MDYETQFRNKEKRLKSRKNITHKYAVEQLACIVKEADEEIDSVKTHAVAFIFMAFIFGIAFGFFIKDFVV